MIPITSSQNPKLKKAIRLHTNRGRKQQGRIILFGVNEIMRAKAANLEIDEVYICEEYLTDSSPLEALVNSVDCFGLTKRLFEKIEFGNRKEGVVAVANRPNTNLVKFDPATVSLVLVLESIEKPGNIGAVFRSACAAGVDSILLADPICDVFHPNAIRASLGTVFSIPVYCGTSQACQDRLAEEFQILATRVDAINCYSQCDLTTKSAIVLGNEAAGLSEQWSGSKIHPVSIPMRVGVDSLNIAMTATIIAFEASRQRRELTTNT